MPRCISNGRASSPVVLLIGLAAAASLASCGTRTPPRLPADELAGPEARAVALGLSLVGTPYRPGGTDCGGFDCSGLVQHVFASEGVWLPREAREQARVGQGVAWDEVRRGDLLFFSFAPPPWREPTHVGIALGDGRFLHAPSSGGAVRVEPLSAFWRARFAGARRVWQEEEG